MAADKADAVDDQVEGGAAEEAEVEVTVIDDAAEPAADPADGQDADEAQDAEPADDAEADLFTAIKQEVTDLRDRYARLQAEWDNYRKRTAAERDAERVRASESLVKDILPVIDDLERAVKHAKDSGDGGSLTEGVEAIMGKMLQVLGKHKVVQIEADGQPFDAMQHQAVGTQEDAEVPEETVVQVYQQGYKMGDRVIRPSMVVTSTGGPARQAADDDKE